MMEILFISTLFILMFMPLLFIDDGQRFIDVDRRAAFNRALRSGDAYAVLDAYEELENR